jgi:hypothetical protein
MGEERRKGREGGWGKEKKHVLIKSQSSFPNTLYFHKDIKRSRCPVSLRTVKIGGLAQA